MSANKSQKQLTKNFFSLTAVQIANYVLPLISVPVISRIIGPDKYGVINFAIAYIAYFNLLISYSFNFTATRKIAKDPDNEQVRNAVFSEVFFTQCLLFGISTVVFIVLQFTVPQLRENSLVIFFTYLLCIGSLFTQNWLFQAMQDLSKVALFNFITKLLFTVAILLVVRKKDDYVWQPLVIGIIQIVVAVWSFIWAFRKYKIQWVRVSINRCLHVLWEERTIFFSLVVVNVYTTTNTVVLGLFQSPDQVGFYTAGQRLIVIAQSVLTIPLAQAFYPFIGKAFGESREKGLQVAQKLVPLIVVFTGVASVCMYMLGPFIIKAFYGHRFAASLSVFQILTPIPLIIAISNVFGIQIMLNLGMDKQFFKITACGAVLSVVLNLLMIKHWGYIGTTYNWLVTEIFIIVCMYSVLRSEGINPVNLNYFKPSVLGEYMQSITRRVFVSKS